MDERKIAVIWVTPEFFRASGMVATVIALKMLTPPGGDESAETLLRVADVVGAIGMEVKIESTTDQFGVWAFPREGHAARILIPWHHVRAILVGDEEVKKFGLRHEEGPN
jgi:hypothetical protein